MQMCGEPLEPGCTTVLLNELCGTTDGLVSSVLPSLPHRLQTRIRTNGAASPTACFQEMGKSQGVQGSSSLPPCGCREVEQSSLQKYRCSAVCLFQKNNSKND